MFLNVMLTVLQPPVKKPLPDREVPINDCRMLAGKNNIHVVLGFLLCNIIVK